MPKLTFLIIVIMCVFALMVDNVAVTKNMIMSILGVSALGFLGTSFFE